MKEIAAFFAIAALLFTAACQPAAETAAPAAQPAPTVGFTAAPQPDAARTPPFPDLQAEILDKRYKDTSSPLGNFDFKNHTYPLPRGWQNPDGTDLTLVDGKVQPVSLDIQEEMSDEEKIERRAARRIGMSYLITKYLDLTGDGQDRFILGEVETGKITGDEEQLCCPIFFTRTKYRWNGSHFLLNGKRLTYSVPDPSAPPLENYGEIVNAKENSKK